jgi:hypothetical protein
MQPTGDPDGDGDGIGVWWAGAGGFHQSYHTGIAMMALAASGHPEVYGDTLQDAVDWLSWAQADPGAGLHFGGWRYVANADSDNSNSGYASLGLSYAASEPPFGASITIPQWVLDNLSIWIDVMQDDVNGDADDGGSYYEPYTADWVNILKTGNLLHEMGLVGDPVTSQRVQDALEYIERHWFDAGGCGTGWMHHRQAMFTMMKGLESYGITHLDLDDDNVPEHDWFAEVATHLITTQNADGSWPWDCWGNQILSTSWALLTLEKAVPRFRINVPFDIHPTSCPNPLNTKGKGVMPVAILGTEDFDVSEIDPASVRLINADLDEPVEVAPLRWAMEDVATPYEADDEQACYACTEEGPDGFMDLTLKFSMQEIVAAIGEVSDGDCLILTLTGNLKKRLGVRPSLARMWSKLSRRSS